MSNLPSSHNKTLSRRRAITNNGTMWTTWWAVTPDGTLVIDPNYHTQYKAGEWRYIVETETRTFTYSEAE